MLTINLVFILRKSVNYSVNLFSNRNMNSASELYSLRAVFAVVDLFVVFRICLMHDGRFLLRS